MLVILRAWKDRLSCVTARSGRRLARRAVHLLRGPRRRVYCAPDPHRQSVGPRRVGRRPTRRVAFRVVAMPGRDAVITRLCTNLPRTPITSHSGRR